MRFTSGLFVDYFVVNDKYYYLADDQACFNLSKMYHKLPDHCSIDEYNIEYGKVKCEDNNRIIINWYDEYKPGASKLRVYKISGL